VLQAENSKAWALAPEERMKPEDIADLKQLIEFLKANQVAEFDLDRGDLKIRLKFNPAEASPVAVDRFRSSAGGASSSRANSASNSGYSGFRAH
jgi:hypothetical protein